MQRFCMRVPALVRDGNVICRGNMNEMERHSLESNKAGPKMGYPDQMHVVRGMLNTFTHAQKEKFEMTLPLYLCIAIHF